MMMVSDTRPKLKSLDQVKREHIKLVLASVDGNKTEAAKILGVTRRTLDRQGYRGSRRRA